MNEELNEERAYWHRRAFAGWEETGLPRAARLHFVSQLFGRKVHSWTQLSDRELAEVAVLLSWKRVHHATELLVEMGQREAS